MLPLSFIETLTNSGSYVRQKQLVQ